MYFTLAPTLTLWFPFTIIESEIEICFRQIHILRLKISRGHQAYRQKATVGLKAKVTKPWTAGMQTEFILSYIRIPLQYKPW